MKIYRIFLTEPIIKAMRIILIGLLALTAAVGFGAEEGLASWYGGKFQGRLTASGEVFDTNKFTAAHKTLPFGTIVRVTNLDNELSVEVRINDRGPFVEDRIIDLSRAAAEHLDMVGTGVARVRIDIVGNITQGPPEEDGLFSIQVGAYSVQDNALQMKQRLEDNGFQVTLEYTSGGIIRVLIKHVQQPELDGVKLKLAELGYVSVVVKSES